MIDDFSHVCRPKYLIESHDEGQRREKNVDQIKFVEAIDSERRYNINERSFRSDRRGSVEWKARPHFLH